MIETILHALGLCPDALTHWDLSDFLASGVAFSLVPIRCLICRASAWMAHRPKGK